MPNVRSPLFRFAVDLTRANAAAVAAERSDPRAAESFPSAEASGGPLPSLAPVPPAPLAALVADADRLQRLITNLGDEQVAYDQIAQDAGGSARRAWAASLAGLFGDARLLVEAVRDGRLRLESER